MINREFSYRIACASLVACFFHGLPDEAISMSEKIGQPTLRDEKCRAVQQNIWTEQEKWVWKEVCQGRVADLHQREGRHLLPNEKEGWPSTRILSSTFLESILIHQPFIGALPHRGVRINGAWFNSPIDLSDAVITKPMALNGCRFDEDVNLSRVETSHWISLAGSAFHGTLFMPRLQVRGSLRLNANAFFNKKVHLSGAIIGDVLSIDNSTFADSLDVNSLQVGTNVFMHDGGKYHDVYLKSADIRGELFMAGSSFEGVLYTDGIKTHGTVFMYGNASFGKVVLRGARIEGQLEMTGSTFNDTLDMDGLHVDAIVLQHASVTTDEQISLSFAKIASNLDISGTELPSLNLTGTQIKGEFRLGSIEYSIAKWRKDAKLILRNTEVGVLQDEENAWPEELELDGFTYTRLGGMTGDGPSDLTRRDVRWFRGWLAKQKAYSPQPYEQIAGVFRNAGQTQKAIAILYQSKERERREVAHGLDWLWLTLLKIFIGYGYQTSHVSRDGY
jgi:hypothetical protein